MKQVIFLCCAVFLISSCASIINYFPKQPRPFQQREFNSAEWKSGDYQTRGEMAQGKLFQQIYEIKKNQKEEILQLLGKPDEITEAVCCYSGRGGTSKNKVELWLYYIEVEESAGKKSLSPKALKIYFDSSVNPHIGERDGDHSYFPMVGYLNRLG